MYGVAAIIDYQTKGCESKDHMRSEFIWASNRSGRRTSWNANVTQK
jgi:hypothetical protein